MGQARDGMSQSLKRPRIALGMKAEVIDLLVLCHYRIFFSDWVGLIRHFFQDSKSGEFLFIGNVWLDSCNTPQTWLFRFVENGIGLISA